MFEGVISVHGNKHAEDQLNFTSKFMCASGTCMTKPPSRIILLESSLNVLINLILNREVNIKADGELLTEVRAEGDAMEVTQCLYEGVDGKVGASEAGVVVKFKNTDGNGNSGRVWGARNESLM